MGNLFRLSLLENFCRLLCTNSPKLSIRRYFGCCLQ
jgi:hypothetical protein